MKTQLYHGCIRKLENLWIQWKDINKQKTEKDDERREVFSRKMDSLWDSAAENDVRQIMSSILLVKRKRKKTWNSIISSYGAKGDEEHYGQECQQER